MFTGMSAEHLAMLSTGLAGVCYLLCCERMRPAWRLVGGILLFLAGVLCFLSGLLMGDLR